MTDNTTAISYINNIGGIKSAQCNKQALKIWCWCINASLWLLAAFIAGKDYKTADEKSRHFNEAIEWMLNKAKFNEIVHKYGQPDIDLFATRINRQTNNYVSWHPEPDASAIDAFYIPWNKGFFYIFAPFSLIGKVFAKICQDRTHAVLVVPDWPTQMWYPQVLQQATTSPLNFQPQQTLLVLPQRPAAAHPLWNKLKLLAFEINMKV